MTTPDYNPAEIEARWHGKWQNEPVSPPAHELGPESNESEDAPNVASSTEASESRAAPQTESPTASDEVADGGQVTAASDSEPTDDQREHNDSGGDEEARSDGDSRPNKGKRRGRSRFYAYPAPISAAVQGSAWPELRRFIAADLHGRMQRHDGMEVSLPVGFSSWGDEVLSRVVESSSDDPRETCESRRDALRVLFSRAGIRLHPDEWIDDADPSYYRWTQWIFLQMVRRSLVMLADPHAVRTLDEVDPDSVEGIEDVSDDKPDLNFEDDDLGSAGATDELAWLANMGPYGDRLMNDLGKSNWPLVEKQAQRHRIGRLRGCELTLQVSHYLRMDYQELKVFTTRIETIYGATFILIHPWHPVLDQVLEPGYEDDIVHYRKRILRRQEPHVSGVRTGGYALNPVNFKRIPVLVSRLAMDPEQNGAVLGVPAHDPLLFDLAHRVKLPVREVVRGDGSQYDVRGRLKAAFCGDGTLTNSGPYSGTVTRVARDRIISNLGKRGGGRRLTCFAMAHLPVSQTSPWGVPVPMIHCSRCGAVPVPESDLPVVAPTVTREDLNRAAESEKLMGLEMFPKFLATTCPECEGPAERDSRVIQSWVGESWKYLRPHRPELGSDIPGMSGRVLPETATESTEGESESADDLPRPVVAIEDLDVETLLGSDPLNEETPRIGLLDEGLEDPSGDDGNAPATIDDEASEELDAKTDTVADEGEVTDGPAEISASLAAESPPNLPATPPLTEAKADTASVTEDIHGQEESEEVTTATATATEEDNDQEDNDEKYDEDNNNEDDNDEDDNDEDDNDEQATATEDSEDEDEDDDDETSSAKEARPPQRSEFQPFRKPSSRRWLSVDLALGRHDRGVMDILHTRFLTKFLYDLREVSFYEPYHRYVRSGDVHFASRPSSTSTADTEDAGEVRAIGAQAIELIDRHGADALRLALLNYTDISRPLEISFHRVRCMRRLLHRIWRQISHRLKVGKFVSRRVLVEKHQLIHEVTGQVRKLRYHRAIAAIYHFVKFLESEVITEEEVDRKSIQVFLVLLSPFAPYLASELWELSGGEGRLEEQPWPEASAELLQPSEREIPVLVDNRLRRRVTVPAGAEKEQLRELALQDERIAQVVAGRPIDRVIAVPDRIVNILLKTAGPSDESSK
jgi:leucyl-tRNA synthetase